MIPFLLAALCLPGHSVEEARPTVEKILARPEFREPSVPFLQEWIDSLQRFLMRRIGGTFVTSVPVARFLLVGILAAAVLLILILLARTVLRKSGDSILISRRENRPGVVEEMSILSPDFRRGEYATALRHAHVATLAALAARGLITLRRSTTNGEVVRQLSGETRRMLEEAVLAHEAAWYGDEKMPAEEYRHLLSIHRALRGPG